VVSALDILTFVVPPQLPALLTLGNIYAQRRLKNQSIYCLSNKFINGGGSLDVVCFDKVLLLSYDCYN
jgi:magnesium-transporting ATPase (P-type)